MSPLLFSLGKNFGEDMITERVISSFRKEYRFLSNFYPCQIRYKGLLFNSSEACYQAMKTTDREAWKEFRNVSPKRAKHLGYKVKLREDWDEVKIDIMRDIVTQKFMQNPFLSMQLKKTSPLILVEGNTWGDTFWGVCNGEGKNHLGRILMEVRSDIFYDYYEKEKVRPFCHL